MAASQEGDRMSERKSGVGVSDSFRAKPFVKVQRQTLPPGRWWWEIHRDGAVVPVRASEAVYRSGQEALEAGEGALQRSSER